eukprot:Hpha_TRINITY_DN15023_c0_g1::TRINITY_DN15023_c0_g1_i1::g.125237::m.125237
MTGGSGRGGNMGETAVDDWGLLSDKIGGALGEKNTDALLQHLGAVTSQGDWETLCDAYRARHGYELTDTIREDLASDLARIEEELAGRGISLQSESPPHSGVGDESPADAPDDESPPPSPAFKRNTAIESGVPEDIDLDDLESEPVYRIKEEEAEEPASQQDDASGGDFSWASITASPAPSNLSRPPPASRHNTAIQMNVPDDVSLGALGATARRLSAQPRGRVQGMAHKRAVAFALASTSDILTRRRTMEAWVSFLILRKQSRNRLGWILKALRNTRWVSTMRLRFSAYHRWRLWHGFRKGPGRAPAAALVYDPALDEDSIPKLKERLKYHAEEISSLSSILQRHTEVQALLREALQRKLQDEMVRLQRDHDTMLEELQREQEASAAAASPLSPAPAATPVRQIHTSVPRASPVPAVVGEAARLSPRRTAREYAVESLVSDQAEDPFNVPLRGYISKGGEILGSPRFVTVEEAKALARSCPDCKGFTFGAPEADPGGRVLVYFKNKFDLHGHKGGWTTYAINNGAAKVLPHGGQPPRRVVEGSPGVGPAAGHTDPSGVAKRLGIDAVQRRRLIDFYQQYNPSKLPSVVPTLREFQGHFPALFKALVAEYGDEPVVEFPPLPAGWFLAESSRGDLFFKHDSGTKQWHHPSLPGPGDARRK